MIHHHFQRPAAGPVRRSGSAGAAGPGVPRFPFSAPIRGIPTAVGSARGRSPKAAVRGRGHARRGRRRSAERHLRHPDRPTARRWLLHAAHRVAHAAAVAAAGGHPRRGPARLSRGRHSAVRRRNHRRVLPADRLRKRGRDRHHGSATLRAAVRPVLRRVAPGCHGRDRRAARGACADDLHRLGRRRRLRRAADRPRAVRPQRHLRRRPVRPGLLSPHARAVRHAPFVRHGAVLHRSRTPDVPSRGAVRPAVIRGSRGPRQGGPRRRGARAAVRTHASWAGRGSRRGHPSRRSCAEGAFSRHPRAAAAGAFRAAAGPAGVRLRDLARRRASRQGRPKDLWRLTCAVRGGARR